jgi:DnaK suppressor protein
MQIGEYGICQDCGADIALARLEIVPMTALCMPCQRLSEIGRSEADAAPA